MEDVAGVVSGLLPSGWAVTQCTHLAELWAGYGHIYRVHLRHSAQGSTTKIVKIIAPPAPESADDEGHVRKMLSYRVEANFYRAYAAQLARGRSYVPQVFAASAPDAVPQVVVLEDLAVGYPEMGERRGVLTRAQVGEAIEWLASFHAAFWGVGQKTRTCPPPLDAARWDGEGVWQYGGYSYLLTRSAELRAIRPGSRWHRLGLNATSPLAAAVDVCLAHPDNPARTTLVHGDVKAANMAFAPTGALAMYDFQYVGLGLGVQDLAKFLTTSAPKGTLERGEEPLLREYHALLTHNLPPDAYPFAALWRDWELALVSWVRFQAGWAGGFWGPAVPWLTHRVESLLTNPQWTADVLHTHAARQ